ncbi:MAG: polysaccharide pyruvyl transferase family protein [Gemmatimonadaceae bacterium]
MHIVIEPGSYSLRNMGDVAMLQVAVRRLRALCPSVELRVLTGDPVALAAFCPEAIAQPAAGRAPWVTAGTLLGRMHRFLPGPLSRALSRTRQALGRRWPDAVAMLIAARLPAPARVRFRGFLSSVRDADLLLIAGQGAMGDATREHAYTVLATLVHAQRAGVPTAMVGQGVGPLLGRDLRARARAVLPAVRLIALRERLSGPALLAGLGVVGDHVVATGDDAVELAYSQRRAVLGRGLGINLRVAGNAGTDDDVLARMRGALEALLPTLGTPPLVPAPIARGVARDAETIRRLIDGLPGAGNAGEELDSPARVIASIADCRLLITGAYHAAVFALAQGIPVVCLATTPYYVDKFRGLLDLFPGGGELLSFDEADLSAALAAAVHPLWEGAESGRGALLRVAAAQVAAGQAAYARVAGLLPPAARAPRAVAEPVALPPELSVPRLMASERPGSERPAPAAAGAPRPLSR